MYQSLSVKDINNTLTVLGRWIDEIGLSTEGREASFANFEEKQQTNKAAECGNDVHHYAVSQIEEIPFDYIDGTNNLILHNV